MQERHKTCTQLHERNEENDVHHCIKNQYMKNANQQTSILLRTDAYPLFKHFKRADLACLLPSTSIRHSAHRSGIPALTTKHTHPPPPSIVPPSPTTTGTQ